MSSKQKPGPKAAANASEAGVGTDAAGRTGAVETAQPQEEASTGWAWSTTNAAPSVSPSRAASAAAGTERLTASSAFSSRGGSNRRGKAKVARLSANRTKPK
ncbi:unnamed protein product, partial [Pylaiella littoralis]